MLKAIAAATAVAMSVVLLAGALPAPARGDDTPAPKPGVGVATFGSGCFWCTERDFDKLPGVLSTTSGYAGGTTPNPTYRSVGRGNTGHAEVVQVTFDTRRLSYETLLDYYWRTTDVVDGKGQFCDRGPEYRPVVITHGAEQERQAKAAKAALAASGRFKQPIAVEILPHSFFTKAEAEHQDYHQRNPFQYLWYRTGCGRDARLDRLWGKDRLAPFESKTH